MSSDEELELIKQRQLAELRRRLLEAERAEQARREFEAKKAAALRVILTPEARARLSNIKMVKPEFAEQLELQLIQLAQSGKIKVPITDEQLKSILMELQSRKRDFTIRRV
ncbi:MAG: DNA-binding protein [Candidatus Methanomethylicota archaeon]|uniref:DNA-binding protein DRJ31_03455 n=1 Tax=Thermoproteota archaeon TaxID=2056631 RepID=A0A497F145_9CREN|nr:MAG: DNA-binding protein [Candidatus Verstraetearchaeota archaeon]RLE52640.1 MAG: DNA-binding protein [Candidatus Verstraetearchaeota archaeon]